MEEVAGNEWMDGTPTAAGRRVSRPMLQAHCGDSS